MSRGHSKKVQYEQFLALDDPMVIRMLRDLTIYDYLPSLLPLREHVFRVYAKAKRFNLRSRGDADMLRKEYRHLISMFHARFRADDFDKLRRFLRERCLIEAESIIFGDEILDSRRSEE